MPLRGGDCKGDAARGEGGGGEIVQMACAGFQGDLRPILRYEVGRHADRGASGVHVDAVVATEGLARGDLIGAARAKLTQPDDLRMRFRRMSSGLWASFKAALPDLLAGALLPEIDVIRKIDIAIREHLLKSSLADLAADMEELLDRSVVGVETTRPLPDPTKMDGLINLGAIDFEKLKALFEKGRGQTAVQLA